MTASSATTPQKRLTIAVVLRFFGSTPTILNPDGTAHIDDPEGHGLMLPVEIYNESGVGVSNMFGNHPLPTKESPLTIYLDSKKNWGDRNGALCDVRVVESAPGSDWKVDIADDKGKSSPLALPWTSADCEELIDRTMTFQFSGRPVEDATDDRIVIVVVGIYREAPALRVEVPLKIVYRGPCARYINRDPEVAPRIMLR